MNHIGLLIDQFEYMGDVSFRLVDESIPSMKKSFKEERNPIIKA